MNGPRYGKPPAKTNSTKSEVYENLEQVRADTLDGLVPDEAEGWAKVAEYDVPGSASNLAWRLRTGRQECPPGEWEFAVRTNGASTGVWARYLFGRSR